ncbi:TIGR03619 family F420-dependent LLM class oxidoreductase [Nonomuraea sp. NPDC003804]|uniref:TIGR03619 family F420-dependent LLM class oxidoreductase n=1 Tax=Nonomuraea sp. NPDC003804 TaxID=3154547 RepID=UPI0033B7ED27
MLGLAVPQLGVLADPRLSIEVAKAAEEMGYDSLWVGDRLLNPTRPTTPYPGGDGTIPPQHRRCLDPLTVLTAVATATSRVRLGTSTLNAFWTPPVVLARSLTTIGLLSEGRLDVGLGIGWSADEYAATGIPWRGRGERLEETLDILDLVWGESDVIRHEGRLWTIPESVIGSKPVQRPAVLLGGFSPAALERIGRRGDGWLAAALPLPMLTRAWRGIQRHAESIGRDPAKLRLIVRVNPRITPEPVPDEQVPSRGTPEQIAGYLTEAVTTLDAEPLIDLHYSTENPADYLAVAGDFRKLIHT